MKTQTFIVEIEMPDGDYIGASILQDDIQGFCDVEEEGRQKVTVTGIGGHADPPGEKGVDGNLPDLEKEVDAYIENERYFPDDEREIVLEIARKFYELGKASKSASGSKTYKGISQGCSEDRCSVEIKDYLGEPVMFLAPIPAPAGRVVTITFEEED